MSEIRVLFLHFFFRDFLGLLLWRWPNPSNGSIKQLLRSSPCFIDPNKFFVIIVIVLLTHSILKLSLLLQIVKLTAQMRKKKDICLSSFLREEAIINRREVDLSNKGITVIDEISPFLCSEIESLNLSNNRIVAVKNLSQFTALKELDISSNKIVDCNELICLRGMVNLKKIFFSYNPFLSEPIEEYLLQLILQKETDIDILSLELIKEVVNYEIQIFFLKNYLNKIELHEELKKKDLLENQTHRLRTQELVEKIIPQFYTVIESPKLTNAIKKEALDYKKHSTDSLEDALSKTKDQKEKKINELLKSIVSVIQESSTFFQEKSFMLEVNLNENTISFSPDRKFRKEFNNTLRIEEEEEFSPVKYIEFSKDDNTFEDITITNLKPAIQETKNRIQVPSQVKPQTGNFDILETTRKNNTGLWRPAGKFHSFGQFKQSLDNKWQKNIKTQSTSKEKLEINAKYTTPEGVNKRQTEKKIEYIKVVDSKDQSDPRPSKKIVFPGSPLVSPRNVNESTISWKNTIQTADQLTAENIEIVYFKYLTKIHPMFSLLHSPASSLKEEEKSTVLEALKSNHKDIFTELVKEKFNSQFVMREAQQAKSEALNMMTESESLFRKNNQLKEENDWIDNRYKILQNDYTLLIARVKQLQSSQRNKALTITTIETSYKKIKSCYAQKMQELQKLNRAEEIEQKIAEHHEERLKQKYLKSLTMRATLWNIVMGRQKIVNAKRDKQFGRLGLESFIQNRNVQRQIKNMVKTREENIVKFQFLTWKKETQTEKQLKKVSKLRFHKISKEFLIFLKEKKIQSTLQKLKNIWALRFYSERKYKLNFSTWKTLFSRRKQLRFRAEQLWAKTHQIKCIHAFKDLIEEGKSHIFHIHEKVESAMRKIEFRKLVYLMKKEIMDNRSKQTEVRLHHEQFLRRFGYNRVKSNVQRQKCLRQSHTKLKAFLFRKTLKLMINRTKRTLRNNKNLKNYVFYLNFEIIKKSLNRQRTSFDVSNRLNVLKISIFLQNLKENKNKRIALRSGKKHMETVKQQKLLFWKLRMVKNLNGLRLKGRNYVKKRAIQQMNFQMDLNDQRTLQLIKQGQQSIEKCGHEIIFLKNQIQAQSSREVALLTENESLMLTFNESCEIMQELRREVQLIKEESRTQEIRYNTLVKKYNEAVVLLQKSEKRKDQL